MTEPEMKFTEQFGSQKYLCAAIRMGNIPAAVAMTVFGAAHITVSVQLFCR